MQGMGARLRARARELGLSDTEVARRLDISQPRYANYVNDINEPDLATLVRICRALGIAPDEALGFADAPRQTADDVLRARITVATVSMDSARLRIAAALMDTLASVAG